MMKAGETEMKLAETGVEITLSDDVRKDLKFYFIALLLVLTIFAVIFAVQIDKIRTDIAGVLFKVESSGNHVSDIELYIKSVKSNTDNILFWMETVSSDSVTIVFLNKMQGLAYRVPMLKQQVADKRDAALQKILKGDE